MVVTIRWQLHLTLVATAIVVGFAISFFMLGYPQIFSSLEPAISAVLGSGMQIWGGWIRDAAPEGGPAAFVALFLLTFWPLCATLVYFTLVVGCRWRDRHNRP